MNSHDLSYRPAGPEAFERLFALRTLAMHDQLPMFRHITPQRLQQSFLAGMQKAQVWLIVQDEVEIGFYALHQQEQELWLVQMHLLPEYHKHGIGTTVLRHIFAEPDAKGQTLYVAALRGSAANRFYMRHGFVKYREDEWDIYYRRLPHAGESESGCGAEPAATTGAEPLAAAEPPSGS